MVILAVSLIAYMYIKEAQVTKRFSTFEKSIEDLNVQIFKLQKSVKKVESDGDELESLKNSLGISIKSEIINEVTQKLEILNKSLTELTNSFYTQKEQVDNKLYSFEERTKDFLTLSANSNAVDNDKIISLYKAGASIDTIAKDLRVGKGEVEFVLRLENLR